MSGCDETAETPLPSAAEDTTRTTALPGPGQPDWWQHENERWVVGDEGRQPRIVAIPAEIAADRPDTTCDGARAGDLDFRAATLRGLGHQHAGTPRQDAYLVGLAPGQRWLVGCVADGVSSGRLSHIAADLACRVIVHRITAALATAQPPGEPGTWPAIAEQLPWQEAVELANAAIVRKASEEATRASGQPAGPERQLSHQEARDLMATTAVAFAMSAHKTADGLVPCTLMVAAGDSSALILSGGAWYPVTAVKNADADIASNVVKALPRQVKVELIHQYLKPGDALAVISDGIGDPLGRGTGIVGRFLAARWAQPPDLLAFANHAAFYRKTFTDDRTAVVIWHRAEGDSPAANGPAAVAMPAGEPAPPLTGSAQDLPAEPAPWLAAAPAGDGPASEAGPSD